MAKKINSPYDTIYFVNHSHIDHTWWNSPEACRERNEQIITELLSIASVEPEFKFSYETTAGLIHYLQKYPDRKDEIANLLKQRRLDVGGLFVSANDDICTPEAIVRNFQFGSRWLEKNFGYSPIIAKEFDTPGHPVQLPQLIRDAGMKAFVITRGPKGVFYWVGPDGTEVFTYCVPYSWSFWSKLGVSFEETEKNLPRELVKAAQSLSAPDLLIPDGDDMTLPNPALVEICKQWNKTYDKPKLRMGTFDEVIEMFGRRRFPRRSGDMPNVWIVIHTLQAETARDLRSLQSLLPSAELLSSLVCILRKGYTSYPQSRMNSLWQNVLLVADHNWGGKDKTRHGAEGDEYKHALVTKSIRECRGLIEDAFLNLSKTFMTKELSFAMPVLVFNPCSWQRNDVVSIDLDCSVRGLQAIEVVNSENLPVPAGYTVRKRHKDSSIYKVNIEFLGTAIPSVGYSTFYIKPVLHAKTSEAEKSEEMRTIENEYYRVSFAEDGSHIESLYDKEFGKELASRAKTSFGPIDFEFGTFELFGVGLRLTVPDQSYFENPEHEGSGESVEPTGEIFRAGGSPANISFTSSGDFSRCLTAEGDFAGSKRRQKVVLYNGLKRVDLHVELDWSGKSNVAVYMQMPTAFMKGKVFIDVPFAVHADGNELTDYWFDESMPVKFKIRGVQDWLCFEEAGHGLAVATRWPMVDLTSVPSFPLLWTNDDSGFFFGERYQQKHNHRYSFSLTSYKGSWIENGVHLWGKQWAKPLLTYFGENTTEVNKKSYLSVHPQNIVLSALKKAEEEDAIVLRLYETTGRQTEAEIIPSFSFQEVRESNITETVSRKVSFIDSVIKVRFRPYEIKTLKLTL